MRPEKLAYARNNEMNSGLNGNGVLITKQFQVSQNQLNIHDAKLFDASYIIKNVG